ncbi:MurR/RpiR family transcriptional regulator [Variovorax sp. OV329]|uniref:MurR/RpiR family transcriptional regulator n=1 Tax=Variovorax sp. OV329 TaxID=1882825 RepID=UPI0008F3A34E|nr:MurR/RpiR family transcriptional regulator [Variovorax sp. OV329]SFM68212.1 transcriptional regulator, RpiR family [Variovorax sp. OV329]
MSAASAPSLPTDLAGLRELIGRESERLTPRMRDAARYTIEHPNDIALNPVATVAEIAQIAPAAFIRMAKALGFGGYSELQRLLREPLQYAAKPTFRERIRHFGGEQPLDRPDDPAEVLRAFSRANIVSLEHLQDNAASLPLRQAITLIENARIVHVLGLRRSYAVAAYLAYALNRVGRPAVQITGIGGAIAEQASTVSADDLLIAVSFPPYAADTLQVCEQVRAGGARRLAITDAVLSPVARNADLVLEVDDAKLLGFRSLTSAMSLAQTLAVGLAFSKRQKRKGRTPNGRAAALPSADLHEVDC